MKNKIFLIIGILAILIVGLSFATAQNKWHGWKTGHKDFDKSAWLAENGLTGATEAEIIAYKESQYPKEDYMDAIREKLGMEDATDEEVKAAMMEWKKDGFHRKSGFRKGFCKYNS